MKDRRTFSVVSILIVASVFLCLAAGCGIPTYLVPTVSLVNVKSGEGSLSFHLNYKSDSFGPENRDKIGLLLMYYVDDSQLNATGSILKDTFKSKYVIGSYDGTTVSIHKDESLFDFTDGAGKEHKVYALTAGNSSSYSAVASPYYNLEVSNGSPSNTCNVKMTYEKDTDDVISVRVIVTGDQNEEFTLYLNSDFSEPATGNMKYIKVYGAISVQSPDYSNLFWSDVSYLGYIQVGSSITE